MNNKKIFALALSFLVLSNNYQQLKAVPPKITTQQTNDEVEKARKTIADCEPLLVFEVCDTFRLILTFVDTYAPVIVGEIQSGAVHENAVSASTVGLKKLFHAFSGYDDQVATLGNFDTIAVSDMQQRFADVYPHADEYTGKYMHSLLKIINNYIPETDRAGSSNVVFSVATLTVKRKEFYEELGNLQRNIVKYFNSEYHSIEEVRSVITERSLRKLKHTLNAKLHPTELQKLEKYEKGLLLFNQVKTILLNTDELLQQPTFFGTLWCGIKSLFGY